MVAAGLDRLLRGLERLLGLVLIAAIILNFGNVVGRYVFGVAMVSADEIEIFALVAITFLGAAVVSWRRQNLRMDVLRTLMPGSVQRLIEIAEALLSIVIAGFVVYVSYQYVRKVILLEQVSDMAEIPMWIPHGSVLAGFLLIALAQLVRGVAVLMPRTAAPPDVPAQAAVAAVAVPAERRP